MDHVATRTMFGRNQSISSHDSQAGAVAAMMSQVRSDDAALNALLGPNVSPYRVEHVVGDVLNHRLMVVDPDGEVVFSIEYEVFTLSPF